MPRGTVAKTTRPGILRGDQKKNAALAQQKFTLWPCPGRTDLALNK